MIEDEESNDGEESEDDELEAAEEAPGVWLLPFISHFMGPEDDEDEQEEEKP